MTKRRHVRQGDRLDDDDTIVVRGGQLDPELLRADARRYHDIYGEYGVTVLRSARSPPMSLRSRHRWCAPRS